MPENASIDLLTSFSLFALVLKENDTLSTVHEKPLVKTAIELYRSGFERMSKIDAWEEVIRLVQIFNQKVLDFNTDVKPLLDTLTVELMLKKTTRSLKDFISEISI
jgi:ATP-dependent DNA helicase RecQ